MVAARCSIVVVFVVVGKGVLLTDGTQVVAARGDDGGIGGHAGQSSGGRVVAGVRVAIVGRCAAQGGAQGVASGGAGSVRGGGAAARGQLGDGHAWRRRLGLLLDGIEAFCVTVGGVGARARGAGGRRFSVGVLAAPMRAVGDG